MTLSLQPLFLGLLLFFIPFNLGYHFINARSYVVGYLVPYFVPTFYLVDIFCLGLLILWLHQLYKSQSERECFKIVSQSPSVWLLLLLVIFAFPDLKNINPWVSLYLWFQLSQGFLFFLYLKVKVHQQETRRVIVKALSAAIIFQSLLGAYQFIEQRPLFPYPVLGETQFESVTQGIARLNWAGEKLVRAYGTAPHPNVLGGFLLLAMMIVLVMEGKSCKNINSLVLLFGLGGLFFTFSRSAWLMFLLGLIFFSWKRLNSRRERRLILLELIILLIVFSYYLVGQIPTVSGQERFLLLLEAIKTWQRAPLFGVGLGNSILSMEARGGLVGDYKFLQPVHNVYLLLLAEVGLVGLVSLLSAFLVSIKESWFQESLLPVLFLIIIGLGFFDHYLITLKPGILLMFMVFGLSGGWHDKKC